MSSVTQTRSRCTLNSFNVHQQYNRTVVRIQSPERRSLIDRVAAANAALQAAGCIVVQGDVWPRQIVTVA